MSAERLALLEELLATLRPVFDPERCSPFSSAWEFSGWGDPDDIDGETMHADLAAIVAQLDRAPRS